MNDDDLDLFNVERLILYVQYYWDAIFVIISFRGIIFDNFSKYFLRNKNYMDKKKRKRKRIKKNHVFKYI